VHVVAALAAVGWAGFARTARGLVLACRQQEYVTTATALGASRRRILVRHILPNVISPLSLFASLESGGDHPEHRRPELSRTSPAGAGLRPAQSDATAFTLFIANSPS
jgi:hypothetical protein